MGKFKKFNKKKIDQAGPLDEQILKGRYAKSSRRIKIRNRQEDEEFVSSKLSKKILKQARKQQNDLKVAESGEQNLRNPHPVLGESSDDSEVEDGVESMAGSDFMEEVRIDEEDEKALALFMCNDPGKRATLADIIKEKLTEKQTEIHTIFSDVSTMKPEDLEKIRPLYKGVGQVLSRYSSGKLPKAFKALPKFSSWEELLYLTEPDKWSAAAMCQATRLFASNLKPNMAQRFYYLVLLPRLRDDIAECKMLNFHLYQALRKSVFKPGAFYKGIILPLCESGTCTLREATIFGSIIAKCSIPVLHSSAAILRIADMEYSGTNSLFLRILMEKKYALPYRVIDAVVAHFLRFKDDKRDLPLLWHQCLLTFAQVYKNDISPDQQRELFSLLYVHTHKHVTPEVRKAILSSTFRSSPATMDVDQKT